MKGHQNTGNQTARTCDVFISYRRDGGDMTAMYFYQALKERGYNVFYDLEVLRAGRFNEALLSSIQSCKDFVLILSPRALDRCSDENDWVRKEIAEALRGKKNIIPVMLKGFTFPDYLPDDIDEVRYRNGLSCTTEYFEESINRLCQRYLNSQSTTNNKKKIPIIAAATAVVALALVGFFALRGGKQPQVEIPAPTVEATVEVTAGPTPEPTVEPTAAPTEAPTPEPTPQVVKRTNFPVLSSAIDRIDGNQNPMDESEVSIRQNSPVLNHPTLRRRDIASVTFLPSLEGAPGDAWDVSEAGDGQVLAWATPNGELYDLTIAGDGGIKIMDSDGYNSKLFEDYVNVTAIRFNACVDLSQRESLREAFWGCEALEEIDFTGVCFENAWDMTYMFAGCRSLVALDTSGWNTLHVSNIDGMFMDCGIEELNLSGLNTSSVTTMESFLSGCSALTLLDLSGFDTHAVTSMGSMFEGCASLETLDLSAFDTSRVTNMSYMFDGCWNLSSLILGSFDTSRVTDMSDMFQNCTELEVLDLHGFDTSRVEDMSEMFRGCLHLSELNVTGWDTGHVKDMALMFEGCESIYSLDLTHFDTREVTDMQFMFHQCNYAVELLVTGWDVSSVEYMNGMFQGCAALENIGRDPATFGHGVDTDMYDGCDRLMDAAANVDSAGGTSAVRNTDFPVLTRAMDKVNAPADNSLETGELQILCGESPVLNHPSLTRRDIASVAFLPSLEGAPADAWDVSEAGDGQVLAWATPHGDLYDLTIAGNGGVRILDPAEDNVMGQLFIGYRNAESIRFNGCVDLSGRTTFFQMFSGCEKLKQLDLTGVCTESALNMASMFEGCPALESLDLSGFDTSMVRYMDQMFFECDSLRALDLSAFNTGNVSGMNSMFAGCDSLETLEIAGFDTGKVIDMAGMFMNCPALRRLDVSGFNTFRVAQMNKMFFHCESLEALDVSGFDTGRVTDMLSMFESCTSLTSLDVSGFNTGRVTSMQAMFKDCPALTALDVSGFDTGRVTGMGEMFRGCAGLKALDVSRFDTAQVRDISGMFRECGNLETLALDHWDTANVVDMNNAFRNCSTLDNINLSAWNTGNVTNMENMFRHCALLYQLDLSNWDVSGVTNMRHMFAKCSYAVELLVTHWDVSSVERMEGMFQYDYSLESIGRDPAAFGHGNTLDMYEGCLMLEQAQDSAQK